MTMLKTFDLKGNKLSFADWISNLSPCETPFVSMVGKEKVDQTQYSWQTDRLAAPNKMGAAKGSGASVGDPDQADIVFPDTTTGGFKEGAIFASQNLHYTKVHTNFTQIFRKAVRVSDTTKKISLYGRGSELGYQMEKAGMEIKRDLEHAILNSVQKGRLGTESLAGAFDGFQNLVAGVDIPCRDTGAIVHKAVKYDWSVNFERPMYFSKEQVFDLTYNLYLAGARANKIMFHPLHMSQFSDWVSSTGDYKNASGVIKRPPHLHRMFDGLDTKYNALVKKIRDPLGQEFTLIPNRHMPIDMLFFFNESDWSQMVLREPEKITLAKMGSSEKQMIEFEVGLRHRNPFASGILRFTEKDKHSVSIQSISPQNILADGSAQSFVQATVTQSDGQEGPANQSVKIGVVDSETGEKVSGTEQTVTATKVTDADGQFSTSKFVASHNVKIPATSKGKRLKVVASLTATASHLTGIDSEVLDAYATRD